MKSRIEIKTKRMVRRRKGLGKHVRGAPDRPRLAVFRSLRHIYAQVIDDLSGRTLLSASSLDKDGPKTQGGNCPAAASVGQRLAERAKQAGISQVVFDRGGRKYHGRVKALAEAAREAGLKF
ncbi:MAG: 50S ribosomal protein L18 [Planctomycetota bacterium]|jgi:large subunit ribosomal protein L18